MVVQGTKLPYLPSPPASPWLSVFMEGNLPKCPGEGQAPEKPSEFRELCQLGDPQGGPTLSFLSLDPAAQGLNPQPKGASHASNTVSWVQELHSCVGMMSESGLLVLP